MGKNSSILTLTDASPQKLSPFLDCFCTVNKVPELREREGKQLAEGEISTPFAHPPIPSLVQMARGRKHFANRD